MDIDDFGIKWIKLIMLYDFCYFYKFVLKCWSYRLPYLLTVIINSCYIPMHNIIKSNYTIITTCTN